MYLNVEHICLCIFFTNYSFCSRVSSFNDLNNVFFHKTQRTAREALGFDWNDDLLPEINSRTPSSKKPILNTPDSLHKRLIFENGENSSRKPITSQATTVAVPGMETPRTPCEDRCLTTPEYNPVCGSDRLTYFSRQRLQCAIKCGKRVHMRHLGACSNLSTN